MAAKLYLVRGHDVEGESQDLFVVADDRRAAVGLWNDYCVAQGWPRQDDDDEVAPRATTVDPAGVREILPDVAGTIHAGPNRVVAWDQIPAI